MTDFTFIELHLIWLSLILCMVWIDYFWTSMVVGEDNASLSWDMWKFWNSIQVLGSIFLLGNLRDISWAQTRYKCVELDLALDFPNRVRLELYSEQLCDLLGDDMSLGIVQEKLVLLRMGCYIGFWEAYYYLFHTFSSDLDQSCFSVFLFFNILSNFINISRSLMCLAINT